MEHGDEVRIIKDSMKDERKAQHAYLDEVPKAVTSASNDPFTIFSGFDLVRSRYNRGRVMHPWMKRPTITVAMYNPIC